MMMMLLPLLGLTVAVTAVEDTRTCEVHRSGIGKFDASRSFIAGVPPLPVHHSWFAKQDEVGVGMQWEGSELGAPSDTAAVYLIFADKPVNADPARIELWRDGRRVSERTGGWESPNTAGYRNIMLRIPYGELRAIARGGPIAVTMVDTGGKPFGQRVLLPATVEEPARLATSAQDEFTAMTTDWRNRCPILVRPQQRPAT